MKFLNFQKNIESKLQDFEIYIWEAPMKEILRMNFKSGDLLYEFAAETRLTVYRRLDI